MTLENKLIATKPIRCRCPNGHNYVIREGENYSEECKYCGIKIFMITPMVILFDEYIDENGDILPKTEKLHKHNIKSFQGYNFDPGLVESFGMFCRKKNAFRGRRLCYNYFDSSSCL